MKTIKTFWAGLSTPIKTVAIIALLIALYFGGSALYYRVTHGVKGAIESYQDNQLQKKNDELEALKIENQKVIDLMKADNIKLKAERDAQEKEIQSIRQAIANDGQIVESEQRKINEARKRYNETKDSCGSIADVDAYVACVLTKYDS